MSLMPIPYDRITATEILQRATMGDPQAISELVFHHGPLLLSEEVRLTTALMHVEELCSRPGLGDRQIVGEIWALVTIALDREVPRDSGTKPRDSVP